MNEPVTQGDRYDVPFTVNGNITGATTIVRAQRGRGTFIPLDHTVTDHETGTGVLTDTSALAVGEYDVELEATYGAQVVTYKTREPLVIVRQIG
jgi:hypothetical protein